MISIAIVEDDKNSQKKISDYIHQYCKVQNLQCNIALYQDGLDIVEKYECQYDILFCDIQMQMMDGLEAARRIRKKRSECDYNFYYKSFRIRYTGI